MSAAEVLAPEISEPLTWVEICRRYPDEWVCLVEMDRVHPFGFEFRSARVVGHGKTRRGSCRLGYQYEVVTVTSPVMRAQHA